MMGGGLMSRVKVLRNIYWAMALLRDLCASTSSTNDFLFRLLNGALEIFHSSLTLLFRFHGQRNHQNSSPYCWYARQTICCPYSPNSGFRLSKHSQEDRQVVDRKTVRCLTLGKSDQSANHVTENTF